MAEEKGKKDTGKSSKSSAAAEDVLKKRENAAKSIAPNWQDSKKKSTEKETTQKKEAESIIPNWQGSQNEMTQKEVIQKRKEAAESIAPNWNESQNEASQEESDVATDFIAEYEVASGDSLWAIADKFYNAGAKWNIIYEANKETIGENASLIRPGQVLKIPKLAGK